VVKTKDPNGNRVNKQPSLAIKLENEYTFICDSDQKTTAKMHVHAKRIATLLRNGLGSSTDLQQKLVWCWGQSIEIELEY